MCFTFKFNLEAKCMAITERYSKLNPITAHLVELTISLSNENGNFTPYWGKSFQT